MWLRPVFGAAKTQAMKNTSADPQSGQRDILLGTLLVVAAVTWVALVWQGRGAEMNMATASLTLGLPAPLFLAIWVLMMVAMMVPTAAPMILAFHMLQADKVQRVGGFVSTGLFAAGYLLVWTLAGIVAYAGAVAAQTIAASVALPPETEARIGGAMVIAAGFYQLTPLKERCLSKCRAPIAFLTTSWRDGASGALVMGLHHGAYCLGCCWLLFVILFPLGLMTIAAMAIITLVILAEKTLRWPKLASGATAAALALYGAIVMVGPEILPTFHS